MFDHALFPAHYIEREIGMFQRIHVELHRVATSICLKDPRQRRRRGVGKVPIYEKTVSVGLLQTEPRPDGAQVLIRRSGPIPFAPATHPGAGATFLLGRVVLDERHTVLASVANPRDTRAIMRPRLQLHLTRWGCPYRG